MNGSFTNMAPYDADAGRSGSTGRDHQRPSAEPGAGASGGSDRSAQSQPCGSCWRRCWTEASGSPSKGWSRSRAVSRRRPRVVG